MPIQIMPDGITEALASTVHFLEDTSFNTMGYAAVVDIGGGTSDISFWNNRTLKWEDSVKFAGGDLVDISQDLLDDIYKTLLSYHHLSEIRPFSYDRAMRIWPYVHPHWKGKMEGFRQSSYAVRTLRTISLFYSGICYYVGMHLRRENIPQPLSHLAFAGNGIRFLEIVTLGAKLSENTPALKNWIKLFRAMLSAGHGISANYDTSITFSSYPKLEVVYGLVSDQLTKFAVAEDTTRKMFGLDIRFRDKQYSSQEWSSEVKAAGFAEADIDFTKFIEFLQRYKATTPMYFKDLEIDPLPSQFDKDMKDIVFNSLDKRGNQELASPLFLEALKAYMKCQYKR